MNRYCLFFSSENLFEPASKVWTRFIEGELRITDKIQQQIMHVGSVSVLVEDAHIDRISQ
jgi:hypothetical protein